MPPRGTNDYNYNYTMSGTMTNGVFTITLKPWIHSAPESSGEWRFKAFWQGDYQYSSIYSNFVGVFAGIP